MARRMNSIVKAIKRFTPTIPMRERPKLEGKKYPTKLRITERTIRGIEPKLSKKKPPMALPKKMARPTQRPLRDERELVGHAYCVYWPKKPRRKTPTTISTKARISVEACPS